MSWNNLEQEQKLIDVQKAFDIHNKSYCCLVTSVFEENQGMELLEKWKQMILRNSYLDFSKPEPMFEFTLGEGHNNFIRHIMNSMDMNALNLVADKGGKK